MSFAERIYSISPLAVQNALISIKGLSASRERFGGRYKEHLANAERRIQWSREQLEEYQLCRFKKLLHHAYSTTTHYASALKEQSIHPSDIQTLEDIRKLPVLEKATLRDRPHEVRSGAALGRILAASTSGTTGAPIRVGYSMDDMRERFALLFRFLGEHGVRSDSKSVRLSGRTFFPRAEKNGIFWRYNLPRRQLFMSTYFLNEENLPAYVRKLVDFKPIIIDGYPSAMYILSRYINSVGLQGAVPLKVAMPTGETLEDHYRDEIAKAFPGALILNQYASAEGAPFITENIEGELVINIDSGVFEFVRPGTTVVAGPGEVAEMIVTSFTTRAYPLIRYRIGDAVVVGEKARSTTWDMPVVKAIYGRQEDIVYSRFRGYVGRLSPALKAAPASVKNCQVVQKSDECFELRVVPGDDFEVCDVGVVVDELKQRLGPVNIQVVETENLERGANGKLRAVIGLGVCVAK